MTVQHINKCNITPIIIKEIEYIALIIAIDKERDLYREYNNFRSRFGTTNTFYWRYVIVQCVLNIDDVSDELKITKLTTKDTLAIQQQLLGRILIANPHVYNEDNGWEF